MSDGMKKCPFCNGEGGVNSFSLKSGGTGYAVKCYNCSAQGKPCSTAEDAIAMWNKRYEAKTPNEYWVFTILKQPIQTMCDGRSTKLMKLFGEDGQIGHVVFNVGDKKFQIKHKFYSSQIDDIKKKLNKMFPKQDYPEVLTKNYPMWGWWWV